MWCFFTLQNSADKGSFLKLSQHTNYSRKFLPQTLATVLFFSGKNYNAAELRIKHDA